MDNIIFLNQKSFSLAFFFFILHCILPKSLSIDFHLHPAALCTINEQFAPIELDQASQSPSRAYQNTNN